MSHPVLALTGPSASADDEQILVDALPYLDTDYNEADRQIALKLIDQECKTFRPTKNYLRHLPVPDYDAFLTPCLIKEFSRISKKQEMAKLDMSRCDLPSPAGTSRHGDKQQWKKAIKNAKAQNEHLVMRELNLELMNEFSGDSYLNRNKELDAMLTEEENDQRKVKEEIMEVHAHRKMAQMDAGRQLKQLGQDWADMVTKNYRMEMAIDQLQESTVIAAKRMRVDIEGIDNGTVKIEIHF